MTVENNTPLPPVVVAKTSRLTKKRLGLIAVAAVGVLALTGGALYGVPKALHAQQVAKYHEVADTLAKLNIEVAEFNADHDAAVGLHALQLGEAIELSDLLTTMGELSDPIVTKPHAQVLKTSGTSLAAFATVPEDLPSQSTILSDAVQVLREADAKAAEDAKAAKKDAPTATAPASYLQLGIAEARELAFPTGPRAGVNLVVDEAVTPDHVSRLERDVADMAAPHSKAQAARDAALNNLDSLAAAVRDALLPVGDVATAAPAQAEAVIMAAPKAGNADTLVAAAQAAAKAPAGTLEMMTALETYVAEAQSVQAAHKAAVDAEAAAEAEAAAVASGANGYTDPGTGNYVNIGGGNWSPGYGGGTSGGYVPPVSGGNGNGYVPPASGGGGNSGGGGYNPGYTPPPHSCTPPPAGWYPTGGSMNGCPTYNPPGGDADEW